MRASLTAAVIVVAVAATYLGSFAGVFQFDDHKVIVENPVVHSLAAWRADLGHGIRPLLKLSYALNWIAGPGEAGFHLVNLGVHLANTLLVYLLARLLIEGWGARAAPRAAPAAAIAALVFGLHPAQTEAVTYISGRSQSLMALFYLGAVAAYAAGTLRGRRWLVYGVSPVLFCLALATKETAVTLPFALVLWDASRGDGARAMAARQWVHWLALAAAAAALLLHPLYGPRLVPELDARSLLTQVGAAGYLVARLVRIYPLNIDPDLREASAWTPALAGQAALLAALLAAGIFAMRRRPWWSFGVFWFFLHLAPTHSLVPRPDLANDRHLYLAMLGFCVALAVELQRSAARAGVAARPGAVLGLLVLAAATVVRNEDYASEIALWRQTARVSPEKPRVLNNLGYAYGAAGCLEPAERAYARAVQLDPGYDLARGNLDVVVRRREEEGKDQAKCGP